MGGLAGAKPFFLSATSVVQLCFLQRTVPGVGKLWPPTSFPASHVLGAWSLFIPPVGGVLGALVPKVEEKRTIRPQYLSSSLLRVCAFCSQEQRLRGGSCSLLLRHQCRFTTVPLQSSVLSDSLCMLWATSQWEGLYG